MYKKITYLTNILITVFMNGTTYTNATARRRIMSEPFTIFIIDRFEYATAGNIQMNENRILKGHTFFIQCGTEALKNTF